MNRRRDAGAMWAVRAWWRPWTWLRRAEPTAFARSPRQLEMILGAVKPVRNGLVDDDVAMVARGGAGRLLHETRSRTGAMEAAMREESNRTYERLRGRRMEAMRVDGD